MYLAQDKYLAINITKFNIFSSINAVKLLRVFILIPEKLRFMYSYRQAILGQSLVV
ncbi:hypothetical protein NIES2109_39870 [Nostoc sp. HK-01]|nr:hypothetical protein NIES2109_39870 [Nostoc sp. HK-01]